MDDANTASELRSPERHGRHQTMCLNPLRMPALLIAVPLVLTLVAGCTSLDGTEPEERTFGPVQDQVTILLNSGDLDVRPADVEALQVTRWFTEGIGLGGRSETSWEFDGHDLVLDTDCAVIDLGGCRVRYEVLVPEGVALTVEGANGEITAAGFSTELRISSDNGGVEVDGVSGPLSMSSSSGRIRATALASDRVDAESENGEVRISFADAPDEVTARTENGALTVQVPDGEYDVSVTTDSGSVDSDVTDTPGSPHAITATTDNGSINLRRNG
ncbi:DUF4097 family beta strand repeat-containing protein [Nocardiopsis sp. HUAS JQ3]|uniref:DUF4097 family beta strand repeat-containing protein n=1 Tax=Nocardiopsis sp. HUAS JQ3 TaxID=3061629 RepID=UPI0023A9DAC9|nr:DUF4097 family beta strand repeat-containing protein [Nocardiopsis sp. HUAS JQ3]WDZ93550.1 DUF4097 family beta strand repeat-containing protein [Nocardiopsis sp. HUAS JQ3]